MSIDALISGRLHGQPAQRTSKNGKGFVVAKVRVPIGADESVFVSVIGFDAQVVNDLLALGDKDQVCISGELKPGIWTDRDGNAKPSLDMTAHAIISAYHVTRRRRAVAKDDGQDRSSNSGASRQPLQRNDFPDSSDLDF